MNDLQRRAVWSYARGANADSQKYMLKWNPMPKEKYLPFDSYRLKRPSLKKREIKAANLRTWMLWLVVEAGYLPEKEKLVKNGTFTWEQILLINRWNEMLHELKFIDCSPSIPSLTPWSDFKPANKEQRELWWEVQQHRRKLLTVLPIPSRCMGEGDEREEIWLKHVSYCNSKNCNLSAAIHADRMEFHAERKQRLGYRNAEVSESLHEQREFRQVKSLPSWRRAGNTHCLNKMGD